MLVRPVAPIVLLSCLLALPAQAATYTVDTLEDSNDRLPGDRLCEDSAGRCSLRAALEEAQETPEADLIVLGAGVHELGQGHIDSRADQHLLVQSEVTVVGLGPGLTSVRQRTRGQVFRVQSMAASLTVRGVTIRNGNGPYFELDKGGNVLVEGGARVLLEDCELLEGQTSTDGGALRITNGIVTLRRVTASDNTSANYGVGGFYLESGRLTVEDSLLEGSYSFTAPSPYGGIRVRGGRLDLIRSRLRDNSGERSALALEGGRAFIDGALIEANGSWPGKGAIVVETGAELTVRDSRFAANFGSGIEARGGRVVVEGSIFEDQQNGGGLSMRSAAIVEVRHSLFRRNRLTLFSALAGGAGILAFHGELVVESSTFEDNEAENEGGAIWAGSGAQVVVRNSTFDGNRAVDGGAVAVKGGQVQLAGCTLTGNSAEGLGGGLLQESGRLLASRSIVAGNLAGGIPSDCSGQVELGAFLLLEVPGDCLFTGDTRGLVTGVDPLLAPLSDNGGATPTRAPLAGSPALDAIPWPDCTGGPGGPLTLDQRGIARPLDLGGGLRCDLGAVELFEPGPDSDGDGIPDELDNCPNTPGDLRDSDGDGWGDACDLCPSDYDDLNLDSDGDGLGDACDTCPNTEDPQQADCDGDGRGDLCDPNDSDGDGHPDLSDTCPCLVDPTQPDRDGDGIGDSCDACPDDFDDLPADSDSDGLGDACDLCPLVFDPLQADGDGDGIGDACDLCPAEPDATNADSDADGVGDACDNCPATPNPGQADSDGDGVGDACFECREPSALDLDPAAPPLRVTLPAAGLLEISWEDTGAAGYRLARGSLAALAAGTPDHAAVAGGCGLTEPSVLLGPGTESVYYLVTADCTVRESSAGRDSLGYERDAASPGCR